MTGIQRGALKALQPSSTGVALIGRNPKLQELKSGLAKPLIAASVRDVGVGSDKVDVCVSTNVVVEAERRPDSPEAVKAMVFSTEAPARYWQLLAEKRSRVREKISSENEQLWKELIQIRDFNFRLQTELEEAKRCEKLVLEAVQDVQD